VRLCFHSALVFELRSKSDDISRLLPASSLFYLRSIFAHLTFTSLSLYHLLAATAKIKNKMSTTASAPAGKANATAAPEILWAQRSSEDEAEKVSS
jgi:hypothetical protein